MNIYIICYILRFKVPKDQWLHLKNSNRVSYIFSENPVCYAVPAPWKEKRWLLGGRGNQQRGR